MEVDIFDGSIIAQWGKNRLMKSHRTYFDTAYK